MALLYQSFFVCVGRRGEERARLGIVGEGGFAICVVYVGRSKVDRACRCEVRYGTVRKVGNLALAGARSRDERDVSAPESTYFAAEVREDGAVVKMSVVDVFG